LAGCLPSLFQLPVFVALYRSFLNLASTQQINEPFLWIPNLEGTESLWP
jgi:YidC/Oxa1 family membrane protein insertase